MAGQEELFESEVVERYDHLTREELIELRKFDLRNLEEHRKLAEAYRKLAYEANNSNSLILR